MNRAAVHQNPFITEKNEALDYYRVNWEGTEFLKLRVVSISDQRLSKY